MEMVSTSYYNHAKALIDAGQLDPKLLDEAVRNILRVKFRLGLFDKAAPDAPAASAFLAPDALAIATRAAAESAVLLKNNGALPLAKSIGKLAVIGPLADSAEDQMGCWTPDGRGGEVHTPLAAIRAALGDSHVVYAQGLAKSRDLSHAGFAAAVEAAHGADAVVLFLGEEQILSGEAHARAFLDLPGAQNALADEIVKTGKPVIAVIFAGRPLTFESLAKEANAVLWSFHPGTMGGPAIASLLFGDVAPSGKLPLSFPRTVGQVPIYYNHMNTGRPPTASSLGIPTGTPLDPKDFTSRYLDVDFTPAYPFGFGLSYTTFTYSNLRLSADSMPRTGNITVSAEIANTGARDGDEVAQLYIREIAASVTQPVRALKGFQRIHLKSGEKKTVEFRLTSADLAFCNQQMQLVTEPGQFHVWVAPDSASGPRASFRVTE
jgi:beta-glucosidase